MPNAFEPPPNFSLWLKIGGYVFNTGAMAASVCTFAYREPSVDPVLDFEQAVTSIVAFAFAVLGAAVEREPLLIRAWLPLLLPRWGKGGFQFLTGFLTLAQVNTIAYVFGSLLMAMGLGNVAVHFLLPDLEDDKAGTWTTAASRPDSQMSYGDGKADYYDDESAAGVRDSVVSAGDDAYSRKTKAFSPALDAESPQRSRSSSRSSRGSQKRRSRQGTTTSVMSDASYQPGQFAGDDDSD